MLIPLAIQPVPKTVHAVAVVITPSLNHCDLQRHVGVNNLREVFS